MAVTEPIELVTGWEPEVPVGDTVLRRFVHAGRRRLPGRSRLWVGVSSAAMGW
jgi:hypothetical protein